MINNIKTSADKQTFFVDFERVLGDYFYSIGLIFRDLIQV